MIKISPSEYRSLLKDAEKLARLEAGGVDNWEWYGDSLYPDGEERFDEFCDEVDRLYPDKVSK